jgi:hypothetical protein
MQKGSAAVRQSTTEEGQRPFRVAIACWIDLLGYGKSISEADFNPLHPKASQSVTRLREFHRLVARSSDETFPTLTLNDGAVAYRDLSLPYSYVGRDFLVRAWKLFRTVNLQEQRSGNPGARMVVGVGFRVLGSKRGIVSQTEQFRKILQRFRMKEITAERAARDAARVKRTFDIVPQLQANFAFTKAYLADQSGRNGGLPDGNFFVDRSLFDKELPSWLASSGPLIVWENKKPSMKTAFLKIAKLNTRKANIDTGKCIQGILNGEEAARRLTNDMDVLSALNRARK